MRVLFVCTGNLCRSPTAQYLLAQQLHQLGVAAEVTSAGLRRDGQPSPDPAIAVLAERGLDLSGHRSHRLTREDLGHADLVLGMAREHVREAVTMEPTTWPHAFTLRELVRRGYQIGPRRPDEDPAAWLARVHEGRRAADLLGSDEADDISDPMGGTEADFRATADQITEQLDSLVLLLWPREAHGALPTEQYLHYRGNFGHET